MMRRTQAGGAPVGQVRGVLAERVVVSVPGDPWLSLEAAAAHTSLSRRTLRKFISELPPDEALPCYRLPWLPGKILLRRSELDAWRGQYRTRGRPSLVRAMAALGLGPAADNR